MFTCTVQRSSQNTKMTTQQIFIASLALSQILTIPILFVNSFSISIFPKIVSIGRVSTAITTSRSTITRGRCQLYSSADDNSDFGKPEYALLFDCDGVILETEELHRVAYNAAFQKFNLMIDNEPVVWSVRGNFYFATFLVFFNFFCSCKIGGMIKC